MRRDKGFAKKRGGATYNGQELEQRHALLRRGYCVLRLCLIGPLQAQIVGQVIAVLVVNRQAL